MINIKEFASGLSEGTIWHGNHNENDEQLELKAGSLTMVYEKGALRQISAGRRELLRTIYPAVRDRNWLTVKPLMSNEKIKNADECFTISLECNYQSTEINFKARYIIEGKKDNSLSLEMNGEVLQNSVKNRIGLCVLHPVEGYAGNNCIIEHIDGNTEGSSFPAEISPSQVFRSIKSLRWMIAGINCRLDFEGDIFETEDHRNWSDASYKTYSTPLYLPHPVILEKGTRIFQKINFRADGISDDKPDLDDATVVKLLPDITFKLPAIGISRSGRPSPLSKNEIRILRAVRFDHYRTELYLFKPGWREKALLAHNESSDLGLPVEFALFFDDNFIRQARLFAEWLTEKSTSVSTILLLHISYPSTPDKLALQVIPILRDSFPNIRTATGTNANFAELNRNRPGDTGNDRLCYSVHPQEHASDNLTLVENLEALDYTVRSAREFAGKKGIIVSPVTLQRRFNTCLSFYELPGTGSDIPPQVDTRIMSLFGAGWTTGSIKNLCQAGADSITYFETAGVRGIMQGDEDSEWPEDFPSIKGILFPVYYVFRFIMNNKTMNAIKSVSSKPQLIECLALTDGKQGKVILVNLTSSSQPVMLDCCAGLFRIRTLDSVNYADGVSDCKWTGIENERIIKSQTVFTIEPYSINFIEGWLKH